MKVVIIEDEEYTAKDLVSTLLQCNAQIEIAAVLDSVESAKKYFKNGLAPDLIISDIHLGDGLSFEIFKTFKIEAPIVYCTAYDHYALEAFRTLGVDYILKPFTLEDISKALDKLEIIQQSQKSDPSLNDQLLALLKGNQESQIKNILIRKGDLISPVPLTEIALFSLENQILYAYRFDGSKTHVNLKLNSLERSCSPEFFRTSRQHLVNRKAVKNAAHYFNRKLRVTLRVPISNDIVVGKLKAAQFMQWLAEN